MCCSCFLNSPLTVFAAPSTLAIVMALTKGQLFAVNQRLGSEQLNYKDTTKMELRASIGKLLPAAMQPKTQKPYLSKKQFAMIYCEFQNIRTFQHRHEREEYASIAWEIKQLLQVEQSAPVAEDVFMQVAVVLWSDLRRLRTSRC